MGENNEVDYHSDDDINIKHHSRLLDEVLQLDKRQYVKKPTRTEATTHVSEFNLVKQSSSRRGTVSVGDLTKTLKHKGKHAIISNKVKATQKEGRTLQKPLEKPQAERIRRTVGFEKSKSELNKWNSIVERNRVAAQLIFPLNDQSAIGFASGKKTRNLFELRVKSELDKQLEELEPEVHVVPAPEKFPLSLEEIEERRKELAKLRARQSYQEAKAHKQNKIKSKAFHRIARKERIKLQIKEFELLQITDPEAALRKLEQLESTRAEERMSLRHRSTGKWAKNKQIRAKYDKESRQALSQQLSISRDLTQKVQEDSSDTETEEDQVKPVVDESNPWVSEKQTEFGDFVSGYRKFWTEKNNANNINEQKKEDKTKEKEIVSATKNVKSNKEHTINKVAEKSKEIQKLVKPRLNKKLKTAVIHCNSSWIVTPIVKETTPVSQDVEGLFEDLENTTRKKVAQQLEKLKSSPRSQIKKKCKISQQEHVSDEIDNKLKMRSEKRLRPVLDEEIGTEFESNKMKTLTKQTTSNKPPPIVRPMDIDPNKYISPKPTNLNTQLPTMVLDNDDDDETDQKGFIMEAFEDDDVVADFNKEKRDLIDKDKPKDIDLNLPGWGCWGGNGIVENKWKKRRFIIKTAPEKPRRDENKGNLIINEDKDTKIKVHQVSELPFPFKSVNDFEASIRAPIGETFVPQTAFRRLIKPGMITRKGTVIEPMSEEVLLQQKFTDKGLLMN